jgi:dinuclear metal center YbgI/SA1388 family protein
MTRIKDITNYLEGIAPLAYQESYDNAGLIVGNPNTEVKGVLVCLDSIEETIEEAQRIGANLIIAHHPIVFKGLKRLNGSNYVERTVISAIKSDIAIYAIHTNLDSVLNGVNAKIAEKLGVKNLRILDPQKSGLQKLITYVPKSDASEVLNGLFEVGAGHIGNYSHCSFSQNGTGTFKPLENTNPYVGEIGELHKEEESKVEVVFESYLQGTIVKTLNEIHPYEEVAFDIMSLENRNTTVGLGVIGELEDEIPAIEFLQRIKTNMKAGVVKYTPIVKSHVKRIAICGGSGSFLLSAAKRNKAHLFLTSDFKYHEFFDAEKQLIIADIGHYESEQYTSELLVDFLKQKFSTFAIRISEVNTNPVNYL